MPEKARAKAIGRHDSLYESCAKEEHERENQYSVLPTIKHPPREHNMIYIKYYVYIIQLNSINAN